MKNLKEYFEEYFKKEAATLNEAVKNRMQELAGIKESKFNSRHAIQIIIEIDDNKLLLEHEQYKKFRNSRELYTYHPEDTNIPVKGHYHVVNDKSRKEIYAVNLDGTAHHKKNKGIEVPKKHAEELKVLGVKFKDGNILEGYTIEENSNKTYYSFFIIFED